MTLPFDPPPPAAVSVSDLTAELRNVVETAFPAVVVEGEVSNCRAWSSGHIYFTLKDDHAQIRAVVFRMTARTLRFRLEDGQHVVVRGRIGLYDVKGEYQIICDAVAPFGQGARQAAFEALKRRLAAEGLFDVARKRPLPTLPRRIGIVTSLDGAAVRDIVRVLSTRCPGVPILVRAARVQGDGAAEDLVRALAALGRVPDIDVIIISRGGGSAEDLDAFNEERLARAIVAAPVPVVSAVGHEIDFTIADFVADVRAATPSNGAEIVVDRADSFFTRIRRAHDRLTAATRLAAAHRTRRLDRLDTRLQQWPARIMLRGRDLAGMTQRLDRLMRWRLAQDTNRFEGWRRRLEARDLRRTIAQARTRLVGADGRLREAALRRRLAQAARLTDLASRLDTLSPLAVLNRGYSVCWTRNRDSIIRDAAHVTPGDTVHVTLASGELSCRVETTRVDPT